MGQHTTQLEQRGVRECGSYGEDLPLWRSLAAEYGDPVLDVGAGTGRVTLDLTCAGFRVTALDRDPDLIAALERRLGRNSDIVRVSSQAPVRTLVADARDFDLGERRFPLVIVPMQTVQLLGRAEGRGAFLRCARRHLAPGGRFGTLAVRRAEVPAVQAWIGHADIQTTMRYVHHRDRGGEAKLFASRPSRRGRRPSRARTLGIIAARTTAVDRSRIYSLTSCNGL